MYSVQKSSPCLIFCFAFSLLFSTAGQPTAVYAESLWSDTTVSTSMYADHKAHAVGDLLTILIIETSSATRAGAVSNSKTASTSMNAGAGIFSGLAAASAGTGDSFKTQGSVANTNSVRAKITVQVTEVRPNGSLVIAGTQSIKQNGEEQKITVTGIVRTEDIAPDNSVLSSNVANAQMRVDGHGPISGKQRQGIITQIFNFLF